MNVSQAQEVLLALDPTSEEFKGVLVTLLNRLDPSKPAGTALCHAIMRVWATPVFEAALTRRGPHGLEVYMAKRLDTEPAYPGEWHLPGTLWRAADVTLDLALARVTREFGPGVKLGIVKPVYSDVTGEDRGTTFSTVFLLQLVEGEPRIDARHSWWSVDALPEGTVAFHAEHFVPAVVKAVGSL